MSKRIQFLLIIVLISIVYLNKESLAKSLGKIINDENSDITTLTKNSYYEDVDYSFVKITDKFNVENKQEILNVFYTVLNSGMTNFTFYCNDNYKNCLNDVNIISSDRVLLSNINNFLNPYNSFKNIETTRYDINNKIEIKIEYMYSKEKENKINNKIDEIIKDKITDEMTDREKIKILHDYIIETTKYDSNRSDNGIIGYDSASAYGPLFEGYGICSGYSDVMKLLLNKINIPSIKISSENHIWNLVYVEDKWYHLDLTWDDPILSNGNEIIDYNYFLITTDELYEKKDNQHYFDENIYKEALN